MKESLFVSDLHGSPERYGKLFDAIASLLPPAVFLGGDLLPHPMVSFGSPGASSGGFLDEVLVAGFARLRDRLSTRYPRVFLILGNDDPGAEEEPILEAASRGLWEYAHNRRLSWGSFNVYGYACVPPTPFSMKDWERYDVSRYLDPGCTAPEEGWRTVPWSPDGSPPRTIQEDLEALAGQDDMTLAVCLFHAPPYRTPLDRAALDGKSVDHVPLDAHVGSIAVRRFIEARRPLLTLHGHVHESARLTGSWRVRMGRTWALSAAHDGPELALVRFNPESVDAAARDLL